MWAGTPPPLTPAAPTWCRALGPVGRLSPGGPCLGSAPCPPRNGQSRAVLPQTQTHPSCSAKSGNHLPPLSLMGRGITDDHELLSLSWTGVPQRTPTPGRGTLLHPCRSWLGCSPRIRQATQRPWEGRSAPSGCQGPGLRRLCAPLPGCSRASRPAGNFGGRSVHAATLLLIYLVIFDYSAVVSET